MAAVSVLPIDALGSDGYRQELNEHGNEHHTHSWNSITQRSALQPASVNGWTPQINPLKPQNYAYVAPSNLSEKFPVTGQDRSESNLSLPPPTLPFTNAHSRPKSMERRRSSVGLPTHLRLGSSGYGFSPADTHRYVSSDDGQIRKWISPTEVISSVVVPLPYMLASLACGAYKIRQSLQQLSISDPLGKFAVKRSPNSNSRYLTGDCGLMSVCALSSATLLLLGCKGKIFDAPIRLYPRKSSHGNRGSATSRSGYELIPGARRIMGRVLCVALPFYATLKLGGDRVALLILISLAADIIRAEDEIIELKTIKGWRRLLAHRRWTLASILLQVVYDFAGSSVYSAAWETCLGYVSLTLSILFIPPPFPRYKPRGPTNAPPNSTSTSSIPRVLATQWEIRPEARPTPDLPSIISPLVATSQDVNLTLAAGSIVGVLAGILFFLSAKNSTAFSFVDIGFGFLSVCATALSFLLVEPRSIRQNRGIGLLLGSLSSLILMAIVRGNSWTSIAFQGLFVAISFAARMLDMNSPVSTSPRSEHHHHHHHQHTTTLHTAYRGQASRFSNVLIQSFQHWPLLHSILVEKDSRRIFYFMTLNFAFMLVQTFYGIATGSLGLLSDSIHMFFDCLALVVGLCAAVMSKWPPSARFPYGYGKMDTLAGFANGIFLMLISIEIVYEAVERLAEGSEMQRIGELLTVSSLGLAVNLIGITAFGHAHHGHSHGGHDHSSHDHSHASQGVYNHSGHAHSHTSHDGHDHTVHDLSHTSHAGHDHQCQSHNSHHSRVEHARSGHSHPSPASCNHNAGHTHHDHCHSGSPSDIHLHDHLRVHPTPSPIPTAPLQPAHSHSHGHKHHHHHHHHNHGNENMHGIYLHILADTLGSVAVVISTLLIHFYGWSGFDPLASCLIAILIFASAIPLVTSSAKTLLLTIPEDTEFDLREALAGISGLRGVVGYAVPKFWLEEGDERKVLGVIHVVAAKGADMEDVKERALTFFRGRKMDVLVQVERDGSDRCWCRGGTKVTG